MSRPRHALLAIAVCALVLSNVGCSGFKSYWQRHQRPHYTITPEFYKCPPKKLAVLPITPRYRDMQRENPAKSGAEAMRAGFYRHVSVKGFEDMEIREIDRIMGEKGLLEDTRKPKSKTYARKIAGTLRRVDVLGVTNLLDPLRYADQMGLTDREAFGEKRFEKKNIDALKKLLPADAFVLGTTKEYGWLYVVLFSYVKVGGDVRMVSADSGKAMWKGRGDEGSLATVIASLPEIPIKFVKVWLNAQSLTLDRATDELFRNLVGTIQYLEHPVKVQVQAVRKTSLFKRRGYSYCFWSDYGKVAKGTRMKFLVERDGWYQVQTQIEGRTLTGWVFGDAAQLIDADNPTRVVRPVLRLRDVLLR